MKEHLTKEERSEYNKNYYIKNGEKLILQQQEYKKNNPEKVKESKKKEQLKNRAKYKLFKEKYYIENKERIDNQNAENYKNKKEEYRYTILKRSYGIEKLDYDNLVLSQNNTCAICNKPETSKRSKYLSLDHCHTTGKIRGLLCSKHNRAIGLFNDDPQLLKKAIEYLSI